MLDTVIRRVAILTRPLFRHNAYTVRSGIAAGLKRRGGLGFLPKSLSSEERFLIALDLTGQVVYDIGAYEGIFTLFFARAVGAAGFVFVWEPNPQNARCIESNVRLNGFPNVRIFEAGIADSTGSIRLTFPKREPALGSMEPAIAELVGHEFDATSVTVPIDSLDHQIEALGLPAPSLVKLDIEGMEMAALRGMEKTLRKSSPTLYIEIHGADFPRKEANIAEVVEFLTKLGYHIQHVESGEEIRTYNSRIAREGHIYCVARSAMR
ncbi:MAG: FkbM family methyltransferase [Bryobacteraceae bacterium]